MGIRFFCPNGHKLNVKEEQAGKRGICPHCGARMEIPLANNIPESENGDESGTSFEHHSGLPTPADQPIPGAQSLGFLTEEPPAEQEESLAEQPAKPAISPEQFPSVSLEPPLQVGPPSSLDDMTVVWYVQTPNGQQFGPATGPVVRTWMAERRIGPTMLVWREGWPEWLQAKNVFPELAVMFKSQEKPTNRSGIFPDAENPEIPNFLENMPKPIRLIEKIRRRRKKAVTVNTKAILILLAAIVVLAIVLALILAMNWHPRQKAHPPTSTTTYIYRTPSVKMFF